MQCKVMQFSSRIIPKVRCWRRGLREWRGRGVRGEGVRGRGGGTRRGGEGEGAKKGAKEEAGAGGDINRKRGARLLIGLSAFYCFKTQVQAVVRESTTETVHSTPHSA